MASSSEPPAGKPFDPRALIETHYRGVWLHLRALGCDEAEASDLTQDTFLRMLDDRGGRGRAFEDHGAVATGKYLRTIAVNLLITKRRRERRQVVLEDIQVLDRAWTALAGADDSELRLEVLRTCLEALTERARLALRLRYGEDATRARLASELKLSEDGAKNLLQRAKEQLRECVKRKLADGA
ncbi:MAG: RNA polymerase sigma factor [Planctomycetota bacterium]